MQMAYMELRTKEQHQWILKKGAQFVLESMKWRNAEKDPPPLDTRVFVKSSGKFVNTGMLVFDSEHKKNIWICGNTNRAWDIDFWKPLPQ